MTQPALAELKVGGSLEPDDLYIKRSADDEAFELLAARQYVNVLTSRQMGKSSLMVRLMLRLGERGVRTATVDMAGDLGTPTDADIWYVGFLEKIILDLDIDVDVSAWWRAEGRGTTNQRLLQFFRDVVAAAIEDPIAIFVDEVDATLKLAYSDDFYTALRTIYNQRSRVEVFRRLTFCLIGTAAPSELIKDRRTTPFNIGHAVELTDFDPLSDDLEPLYAAMSEGGANGEVLVRAVLDWTGGHPFLTLALCRVARERAARDPDDVDHLVEGVFSEHTDLALRVHYEWINNFISTRLHEEYKALRLYDSALRGRAVPDKTTTAHVELKLSGLVKRTPAGTLVVRNRLYAQRFGPTWLAQTGPIRFRTRILVASAITVTLVCLTTVGVIYDLRRTAQAEEAAKIEKLFEDLGDASDETVEARVVQELCRVATRPGGTLTVARVNEADRAFWERRANALDVSALKAISGGDREWGLVLGALASVKRGTTDDWLADEYAKSDGPILAITLRGHGGAVNRVRFLGSKRIVSMSVDSTIRIFDLESGGELHKVSVEAVSAIEVCPDADCILAAAPAASGQWRGLLWDADLARSRSFDLLHSNKVYSIAAGARDTSRRLPIATGSEDATARVGWLPNDGDAGLQNVSVYEHHSSSARAPVYAVRLANGGERLLTAALDGIRIWPAEGRPRRLGVAGTAFDARFSPLGDHVVFGTDQRSGVWDLLKDHEISHFAEGRLFITSALSGDEKAVVNAATSNEGKGLVVVWRVLDGEATFRHETTLQVRDAEIDPTGKLVAAAYADGNVRLLRLEREEASFRDPYALWTSWQKKFGYAVSADDTARRLGDDGPQSARGYRQVECR